MSERVIWGWGALCAVLAVVALAGCGGGSSESGDETTLRGTTSAFPDYLDPALSVSLEGSSAMWNTYLPLLTYPHADGRAGTKLVPGLARSLPKVSDGGRTYTLFLRSGLRYSDGTPVRASDFRHSVERLFVVNSGGSFYFDDVVGAERFAKTKQGGIPGIETDDASGRITIHLREANGTFVYGLGTLFAAPLPADTPMEDLSAKPPPATGPYEIVSVRPGRSWEYRRNPEWGAHNAKAMPDLPGGHFERIEMKVMPNTETQLADVERDAFDWMVNPPSSERLAEVRQRHPDQLLFPPQINIFYFWMNTREPPFDDVRVRRAVNYAIDPAALDRIYAGELEPRQQILPRAMPGGSQSFELYPHDMAKAKELVAAADPSERKVDVWTNNFPTNLEAGEYYEGVLRELGFEPTLKVIDPSNFFTVTGNLSTPNLDTGWGNWLLEYPHPNNYFEPQLTAKGIQATNNTNRAQIADPRLDREVTRLRRQPLGPRQEAAYAALDRAYMRQAPWAPFGTLAFPTFVSPGIDAEAVVVSPIFGQDLTSFQRSG